MKKILNFSRVAIALFCFMLIGLTSAKAVNIAFAPGTDIDPNKAGVQVCANTPVTLLATPGVGDLAPFQWQLSDNGGATWQIFGGNGVTETDIFNPKPGGPLCRQYRVVAFNAFFPFTSISTPVTACAVPNKGMLTITAPAFVCQDAPNTTVTASASDATDIRITRAPAGTGTFTGGEVLTGNLTATRIFDHNQTFSGTITFTATADGCVAGLFVANAMTMTATTMVKRALDDPAVEPTIITSSTGSNQVCEGDVVTYTASNSRAFGNPLFSFSIVPPTAGTLVGGPNSATGAKTINWSAAYPPAGPNPVQVVASAFGCLNPAGPDNGALGQDAVGVFPVFIRQRPIVQAFQTLGANPDCPGQCRVLQIFFDEINGFAGNKDIVIHTTDGNPDITYQSAANPVQIVVCPNATTTYSIVSVTAANPPNNVCGATGPFPGPRTLTVTPNTAINSLTAAPAATVCLGTNVTLTANAVGGSLTYTWRKIAGVGASATPLQGPNGTNTFVVSGASVNNSGTYQVQVSGTCGPDQFATIVVTIVTPSVGGTIAPALVNRCGIGPNTLTLTGQTGAVLRWESQPNCTGPWITIPGTAGLTTIVVTAPAGTTCYRAVVQNAPCPAVFSTTTTINVDLPAVGGFVGLQGNLGATSTQLCAAQNAVLVAFGFTGKVQKWQFSTANTGFWQDIPGTAGQTTLTVNGSTISTTTFFRAVICTQLGICTGPSAVAFSSSFRVVKKALCPGPDGSIVSQDQPEQKTAITKAYPTPTSHRVTLDIQGAAEGLATIEVVDLIGRVVKSQKTELFPGDNQVSVDISELASGIYIVKFTDKANHRASMKITRQ
jgi:hypothetical protein